MNMLAISGSARAASVNTALLQALARCAPQGVSVQVFADVASLPIFSPDREGPPAPPVVEEFAAAVARADGLIVACPEYVRAMPGGFKNAIDWLVSRDEIVAKPIALIHASHRGDDMLDQLRLVLSTVSENFTAALFERFALKSSTPAEVAAFFEAPEQATRLSAFLDRFARHIRSSIVAEAGLMPPALFRST
ncbi:MAG: NAD(P)H-dependent oxidoreductase [Proteobacteria bacterium]|nr:NAD(P)H-dependent oxidoreductase [Pseudomonadota bacterium]